jgi:electron transfer flavoprotein alpha subunit
VIFKALLNGCAANIAEQAEEINGFIGKHLSSEENSGSTILFYSKKEQKNVLIDLVTTASVKLVNVARYQPENILEALVTIEKGEEADLYIFPSGYGGAELAVRLAFRMKGSSLVQVHQIECLKEQLIAKKTVYSSNAIGTLRLNKKPFCISLARGSAESRSIKARDNLIVTEYDMTGLQNDRFVKAVKWTPEETTKDLEKARFLLIGGRGMGSKQNTENLNQIADDIGAVFGVSRPVAMNAWAPMKQLIGVSGTLTKPDVCIVAAASGAAAFYAGIEKSRFIVAINEDIRAPIIRTSDVVIIDDYKAVMDELAKIMGAYNSDKKYRI